MYMMLLNWAKHRWKSMKPAGQRDSTNPSKREFTNVSETNQSSMRIATTKITKHLVSYGNFKHACIQTHIHTTHTQLSPQLVTIWHTKMLLINQACFNVYLIHNHAHVPLPLCAIFDPCKPLQLFFNFI